jgi:hypothetical protein
MKNQTTSRDHELLSAYLDNHLGNEERAHLESRLIADPELKKELYEISNTRLLLRSMPKMRAPRNYYVTAKDTKTARTRGFQRLAPAYGIVSAVATILLVLLIFGDRLVTSTSQVALAPASVAPIESVPVQKEVERSVVTTSSPTETPPMMVVEAPAIVSTVPPSAKVLEGDRSEIATPTTIYLNALPPTPTPEISMSILNDQSLTATISCDGSNGSGPYPTIPYACPSPTSGPSGFLLGILPTSTPTSADSPTPTQTSTSASTQASTSTPTSIPSATPTATSVPTEIAALVLNTATESVIAEPTLLAPSDQAMDIANPTIQVPEPSETPGTNPNLDFLKYLVLSIELSLAAIAIIAGIVAIILRIRAGR